MKIRIATNKDKDRIKEFVGKNLREIFNSEARGLEDLDDIKTNFEVFFIAEENGVLVGTAGIKNEKDAKISRMYIDRTLRGKGYGKKLINKIINYCDGKYKRIFLTTYDIMNSEEFYRKMGFISYKRKKEIKVNKIWMEMNLK